MNRTTAFLAGLAVSFAFVAQATVGVVTTQQVSFCSQADSFSYCLTHPGKGDDVRLGA